MGGSVEVQQSSSHGHAFKIPFEQITLLLLGTECGSILGFGIGLVTVDVVRRFSDNWLISDSSLIYNKLTQQRNGI